MHHTWEYTHRYTRIHTFSFCSFTQDRLIRGERKVEAVLNCSMIGTDKKTLLTQTVRCHGMFPHTPGTKETNGTPTQKKDLCTNTETELLRDVLTRTNAVGQSAGAANHFLCEGEARFVVGGGRGQPKRRRRAQSQRCTCPCRQPPPAHTQGLYRGVPMEGAYAENVTHSHTKH